jgi:polyisoprenoid-binding protein YceI
VTPNRILAAACLALAAGFAHADAPTFTIDPVHSQVFFSASHDGYTNPVGRLRVKSGTFRFDADDWSSAQVDATIDIGTLDMGDGAWNRKLLSSYFDASNHPTAHYVSTGVEKTGDRTGVVHGKLTLLGRTQPVDLQLTFNRAAVNGFTLRYIAGFSASANFKRSAFGMTRSLNDVGDDVAVRLEIEGERGGSDKPTDEKGVGEKPAEEKKDS